MGIWKDDKMQLDVGLTTEEKERHDTQREQQKLIGRRMTDENSSSNV